jgi:hypothetical protein
MVLNKSDKTEIKFPHEEWTRMRDKFPSYIEDGIRFNIKHNEGKNYDTLYISGLKQLGNKVGGNMREVADIIYDESDGSVILKIKNKVDVEMINNMAKKILSK